MKRVIMSVIAVLALLVGFPTAALADAATEGGHSFNDATRLTGPGTVEQDLVVGETLFWQIDLKPGQTLKVSSTTVFGDDYHADLSLDVQYHLLTIYLPSRKAASCLGDGPTSVYQGDITGTVELSCDSGVIGDGTSTDEWSQPGTYYVTVATTHPAENVRGLVKPLTLKVELEGEARPAAELEYDAGEPVDGAIVPTAPPAPTAKPRENERGSRTSGGPASGAAEVVVPAGAGVLGCLLGGAIGFVVRRSRSKGAPPPGPPAGPPPNPPWPYNPQPPLPARPQPPRRPQPPPQPPAPAPPQGWQPRPRP